MEKLEIEKILLVVQKKYVMRVIQWEKMLMHIGLGKIIGFIV